ncbi:ABC transporter ATP-binding protein [Haloplasma contractile]|uniref:ABC transporter ATP-binding component protein n=1 Tax=Haloplasma contractile SSD-17B TaxID=1033810 RepID=F7PVJ3_9MOLU|nr:ABC transporter ATP-binding protein [Haloplasma contractile]ERJ12839.1 ABC transporter ATP-binding component protein [Haloplasma contractile SSD-17B]
MDSIIKIENLKKFYNRGKIKSVNDVSLSLSAGKVYGLIGPNGAGKTTLVKLILGAIKPTEGTIQVDHDDAGSIHANKMIGYVCEKNALPFNEDPYEYLMLMAVLAKVEQSRARKIIRQYLTEFGLGDYMYKKMKTFSSGMKKKVQIIAALLSDPEILILDEPTANLDPKVRYEIFNFIKEAVISKNNTVILCSHNLYELEKIVDDIIMINKGRLIVQGSYTDIVNKINTQKLITVKTQADSKLIDYIKMNTSIAVHKTNPLTLTGATPDEIKKTVVQFCYQERVTLDELKQVKESLYEVFEYFNSDGRGGVSSD